MNAKQYADIVRMDMENLRQTSMKGIFCSADGIFYKHVERNMYRIKKITKPDRYRNHPQIVSMIKGVSRRSNAIREVYEAWYEEITNTDVVIPKNGNWIDLRISNLKRVPRAEAINTRERYVSNNYTTEATLRKLAIYKKECDLAINFAVTGSYQQINQYVEQELFLDLYEYGMNSIKHYGKQTILNAVAESLSILYDVIDSNRAIVDYTGRCRATMRRYCHNKGKVPEYSYSVYRVKRPIDDVDFEKIARKYGLIDS